MKLQKKTKLLEKFKLPAKRGFELMEIRREIPAHWPTPIHKLSMTFMV